MSNPLRLTLVVVTVMIAACNDDPTTAQNDDVVDCAADATLDSFTWTTGPTLRFDWSPRCRITLLLVEEGAHDKWSLRGDEQENDVAPPVTYGVAPSGLTGSEAEPLESGHTYEVILWQATPQGERILAIEEYVR